MHLKTEYVYLLIVELQGVLVDAERLCLIRASSPALIRGPCNAHVMGPMQCANCIVQRMTVMMYHQTRAAITMPAPQLEHSGLPSMQLLA